MKNIHFTFCFLALAGFVLTTGSAAAAQSPHWLENNINCLDCHADHNGTTTPCIDCHDNSSGANYSKLSAPAVDSHVGFTCITCHDPHSSAQCTLPLVTGTFSNYQINAQTTTFTIQSLNVIDPAWSNPASWSEKSGAERGLIYTVTLGLWDTERGEYVDQHVHHQDSGKKPGRPGPQFGCNTRAPSAIRLESEDTMPGKRKERVGLVVSDKMEKSIVVKVTDLRRHPLIGKVIKHSSRFVAHDEKGEASIGDKVRIQETRPLSKTKCWVLKEVMTKAKA